MSVSESIKLLNQVSSLKSTKVYKVLLNLEAKIF